MNTMIISTLIIANQYSDSPVKWFPSRQILTSAENGQNHTVDSNMYELKRKNWDDDNQCPLPCLYFRRPKLEKKERKKKHENNSSRSKFTNLHDNSSSRQFTCYDMIESSVGRPSCMTSLRIEKLLKNIREKLVKLNEWGITGADHCNQ